MQLIFDILRTEKNTGRQYRQEIELDTAVLGADEKKATVATALRYLDKSSDTRVAWDCGCLQRRCGTCAMVINKRPALACDARLAACAKKGRIRIEPLGKFPVIEDLRVDRTILQEHLKSYRMWQDGTRADSAVQHRDVVYEASRCLQCGLCLEVCPNYYTGGRFFGTATAVPAARLFGLGGDRRKEYGRHVYAGCGKSLSCRNICPAGIDVDALLARNNRQLWGRQ
ncbi:MAG: 4Fe-4S dicluster domain-containing protein [Lachnospiraceae bacterium]|nr:4Fe-4S dicluster domain-containing protein [Lachnospiraceae bacterium]